MCPLPLEKFVTEIYNLTTWTWTVKFLLNFKLQDYDKISGADLQDYSYPIWLSSKNLQHWFENGLPQIWNSVNLTFNQYHTAVRVTPQAGNSSFSTNWRSFSRFVIHNATRAPSSWASCLTGSDNKCLLGRVGYLASETHFISTMEGRNIAEVTHKLGLLDESWTNTHNGVEQNKAPEMGQSETLVSLAENLNAQGAK